MTLLIRTANNMHSFINKQFPGFEEATGWSIAAKYPPLPDDLRKRLVGFVAFVVPILCLGCHSFVGIYREMIMR